MKRPVWLSVVSGVVASAVSLHVSAGTISYLGSDLGTAGGIAFPFGPPSVTGSSAVFPTTPVVPAGSAKLFRLPIFAAGQIPAGSPITVIEVSITLSRLLCDVAISCAASEDDWDPILALADGVAIVGGSVSDPAFQIGPGATDPVFVGGVERDDGGDRSLTGAGGTLMERAGFPAVGEALTFSVTFSLSDALTELSVTTLGATSPVYQPARSLDRSRGLELVLVQDDAGERYQVDRLSISGPGIGVPEPGTLGLVACSVLAYRQSARVLRRRGKSPLRTETTTTEDAQVK